jgi:hypothetical protein
MITKKKKKKKKILPTKSLWIIPFECKNFNPLVISNAIRILSFHFKKIKYFFK